MSQPVSPLNLQVTPGTDDSAYLQKLGNFFPAIVFIYEPETERILSVNDKLTEYLGYSTREFENLKYGITGLVYQDDLAIVQHALDKMKSLQDQQSITYTARFDHKDGGCRHLKSRCTRSGALVVMVCEDISAQVRFEDEAKSARQLFDETEKLLLFGSWSWSLKDDKIEWTDGMVGLLEYDEIDAESVTIDFFFRHVLADHSDHLRQVLQSSILEKKPFEVEFVIKTGSGMEKFVFMKGKPFFDNDGNVKKLVGITRDITAKKNSENERDRNIRELNRSNKELEEFAYVASHDLHEPLRKILTFSERLRGRFTSELGDDGKIYLDRIWASADSMRNLIDNLLEFSRISRGSRSFVNCEIRTILKEVLADQELRIEETSTIVNIGELPVVEAVPAELKQLFNNLLGNALKFRSRDSQPVIEIVCRKLSHKEKSDLLLPFNRLFYQINIKDNGIGFERVYAEKIFEIFQRLHGKAEYSGSGIGLAICKKIVDNHDGIIYASSDPGKGSTFSVILPEKQL